MVAHPQGLMIGKIQTLYRSGTSIVSLYIKNKDFQSFAFEFDSYVAFGCTCICQATQNLIIDFNNTTVRRVLLYMYNFFVQDV